MILELDEKEKQVLLLVLKSFEWELKDEIGKTSSKDFKDDLRGEEEVIKKLIAKVS
jgi:hypothetical protein